MNFLHFFTDPVLRAPTLGSMLMGLIAGMVGVLVFLRKRSLLGESLSHATYPGVALAIVIGGIYSLENSLSLLILFGAFVAALTGYFIIELLEKKCRLSSDSSLTAVLALFFGIGITVASFAQNFYAHLFRQIQAYLYGQVATMTDLHVIIYAALFFVAILFIVVFYKEILTLSFDRQFAYTAAIGKFLETTIFIIIVLALVIGVRSVGIILMSAMLIAPAVAARQFTNRLGIMFVLAGFFGAVSSFLGVYFSVVLSQNMTEHYSLPTGPLIVMFSGSFALYALFFAPKRGLIMRYIRVIRFRILCTEENLIKGLWRLKQSGTDKVSCRQIARHLGFSMLLVIFFTRRLRQKRLVEKSQGYYSLTAAGNVQGAKIVRLHRLWEVYLVNFLGLKIERVHKSAEEMEHILTPELERKLVEMLDYPLQDPHDQPIPICEESRYAP